MQFSSRIFGCTKQNIYKLFLHHPLSDIQGKQCPKCGKVFQRRSKLRRHIAAVHEGIRPYPCEFCESRFSERFKLKKHIRSMHTEKKPIDLENQINVGLIFDHTESFFSGV